MPCSCQIPGPAYPENKEWGPFLWTILHGLAERSGKVVFALYENDERRAWVQLLQTLCAMLPCSECRDHCKDWIQSHPVTSIQTIKYAELPLFIKNWLWSFHEAVNSRLGKPSFPFENLTEIYGNINITMQFKLLELIEKKAIQQQGVPLQSWLTWVKYYRTLTSVYGIS